MEVVGAEADFDEIERLLYEIPNVTSGNTLTNESGLVASSPDLKMNLLVEKGEAKSSSGSFGDYFCSQTGNHGSGVAFSSTVNYQTLNSVNSFNKKLHSNGAVEEVKFRDQNGYQAPEGDINENGSNLLDNQSLTSAFAAMNFKEGEEGVPTNPGSVKYESSQEHTYLTDGKCPKVLRNSISGLDSVGGVFSLAPRPSVLNGINLVKPMSTLHPTLANVNGISKFNGEMNGRESDIKKQSHEILEYFSGDGREHARSLPIYSGAVPYPSAIHAPPMLTKTPFSNVGFPLPAFQQQYYLDALPPYIQQPQSQQHLTGHHIGWRHVEEEHFCRMPHVFYFPQVQNHESGLNQIQPTPNIALSSMTKLGPRELHNEMPMTNRDLFYRDNAVRVEINQSDLNLRGGSYSQYYAHRIRGHEQSHIPAMSSLGFQPASISGEEFQGIQFMDKVERQVFPEKILTRSHGLNSLKPSKPVTISRHELQNPVVSNGRVFSNGHYPSISSSGPLQLDGKGSRESSPDNMEFRHSLKLQHQKYNSVDEVVGRIFLMAKDQHGCRFLQRKFTEGSSEDVEKIFVEIIDHIVELMVDPFGNYLVQKLLEVCNEDQRMQILKAVTTKSGDLIRISCDMHGTRAVQKVIETLKSPEQISMIVSSLKPGIVMLIKDMNGNHVAQRCLSYLMPAYSEFLYKAAIMHCVELATDRHGCCVLQKCLHHSGGVQKKRLITEITSNALVLSQDPFGNYVVQYIIEQGPPWATENVLEQLKGNFGYLSMQKYSSNVVEKCLKFAEDERRALIIQELIDNSQLSQISQDPYGNYVVQSALAESKGAIRAAFVEAIRRHLPTLRSSPFGKKVLSCNSLKK